ncbi:MAG: type II toxin-antitoxin system prevent-host-death family antitoxin [Armatimonadetes bacterium]|nr:type II toxin-antitoxin system prevent-host-death family antitoxin [Armatimonadota bacterium]
MRLVSTAELKNRTNEVLRTVQAGEPVIITRHGRPVASLTGLVGGNLSGLLSGSGGIASRATGARVPSGGYAYAAFALPFGTFYVAFGSLGPAFARIATSSEAFERDAGRYLGTTVRRAARPRWLADAVRGAVRLRTAFGGPVDLTRAGPFEQEVLAALRRIPTGEVRTYGEIARAVGQPGAARAVGTACARNPVPLLIPCHRVVRSDGGLGGYSLTGGVGLKRRLLESEGALPRLPLPRAAGRSR